VNDVIDALMLKLTAVHAKVIMFLLTLRNYCDEFCTKSPAQDCGILVFLQKDNRKELQHVVNDDENENKNFLAEVTLTKNEIYSN